MKTGEVWKAWAGILTGHKPTLSIEITKECPLRCPGCYAFDEAHLGGDTKLRQLSDFKGTELVTKTSRLSIARNHCMFPWSAVIRWFAIESWTCFCLSWKSARYTRRL